VLAARGCGKSKHYDDIRQGKFTSPVSIGPRAKRTPRHELEKINRAHLAGATDDEIKALVQQLLADRKVTNPQETPRPICRVCNDSGTDPRTNEQCHSCSGFELQRA
jgi:prophage regulatory protein